MAIIYSYPEIINVAESDLLVISDISSEDNPTKNIRVSDLATFINALSGTVTSIDTGVGLEGGPITTSGTISLSNTSVVAGQYNAANITVDEQGRITGATNGNQGIVGPTGAQGNPGAAGTDGAQGSPGVNGSNGTNGSDGAQGVAGADGTSIEIQGTVNTVGDLPATGNTVGDLWIIDQTGGGATAGDGYVWTVGNTWLNIGPLRGPQGVQGITGVNGTNGVNGTDGVDGTNGSQGIQGVQGNPGIQGEPGASGVTNLSNTNGTNAVTVLSSTGTGTDILAATTSGAGVMSSTDKIKLDESIIGTTVSQTAIVEINTLSQASYNALVIAGTTQANVMYIIDVPAPELPDPYTPVMGTSLRLITGKTTSPYFSLFDSSLSEVTTSYTYADVPNNANSYIAAASDNFTYMLTSGTSTYQTVSLSIDNGQSWNSLIYTALQDQVHISKSGKVMIVETPTQVIYLSNDFGSSFLAIDLATAVTAGTATTLNRIVMSSGGKYILAVVVTSDLSPGNTNRILKSIDYGATFSDITSGVGFPDVSTLVNIRDISISGNGQYQIYFNSLGASRYSNDYGQTFTNKFFPQTNWEGNSSTNQSGQYFTLATNAGGESYSNDYGSTGTLYSPPALSTYSGFFGVSNSGQYSLQGTVSSGFTYSANSFASFSNTAQPANLTNRYLLIDRL